MTEAIDPRLDDRSPAGDSRDARGGSRRCRRSRLRRRSRPSISRRHANRANRVSTPHTPAGLAARFDEPMPRDRPLDRCDHLAPALATCFPTANHLYHPRYVGHQIAAPLPAAVWTEAVTAALNQSVAVFEMSPVGTVLEHRVIRWMCDARRLSGGGGGTLTSGGTEATFTALLAARGAAMPDAWTNGVGADPPVLLCGEHAHYAVTRAAAELGLGMKNVLPDPFARLQAWIPTRCAGARSTRRDRASESWRSSRPRVPRRRARSTISRRSPRSATSIGVWLHVDAAHGGSALLSRAHRHGCAASSARARIAWDPHKMMLHAVAGGHACSCATSAISTPRSRSARRTYFTAREGERVWDQGTRSFMCSRRADVFKLWVALQRYGVDGLAELHDYFCALTRVRCGRRSPSVPTSRRCTSPSRTFSASATVGDGSPSTTRRWIEINRELRERYNRSGEGWITATNLDGRRVLRVTMMNPRTTADIRDLDGGTGIASRSAERHRRSRGAELAR